MLILKLIMKGIKGSGWIKYINYKNIRQTTRL